MHAEGNITCKSTVEKLQESIRKARYSECLVFLFATDHRHIFCSSWSRRISEKSRKEICIAATIEIFVLRNLFSRIVGAWNWKSAILSKAPRICQHEDILPIRAWYQNLVSWNCGIKSMSPGSAALSPSPDHHSARFARRYFSYLTPFFAFFHHCGAWDQALAIISTGKAYFMSFLFLLLKGDVHLVKSYNSPVIFVQGICRTNDNHLYGNQYIQYSA